MRRADELDPAKLKTPKGRPTKHTAATMVLALKEQKRRLTTPEWRDLCDSEKGIPKSTFYELKDEAAALPEVAQTKAGLWFYKAPKK